MSVSGSYTFCLLQASLSAVGVGVGIGVGVAVGIGEGVGFGSRVGVGAGVEVFVFRNKLSLNGEYTDHVLFGEGQDQGVLSLLGLNRVSFDVQSIVLQLYWHLF